MKVKKYTGETMQDVIFQVKADLGQEAVIVDKRKVKKGGILGFFTKTKVEVVAALEDSTTKNSAEKSVDGKNITSANDERDSIDISNYRSRSRSSQIPETASKNPAEKNAIKEFIDDLKYEDNSIIKRAGQEVKNIAKFNQDKLKQAVNKYQARKTQSAPNKQPENKIAATVKAEPDSSANTVKEELSFEQENLTAAQRLQSRLNGKTGTSKNNNKIFNDNQLYNYLLDQGVESRNLNLFLNKINSEIELVEADETVYKDQLNQFFNSYFAANSGIDLSKQQTVISFVGPTGVGKTTTMAKIAAHFAIEENKKVALVTADTYRIAAVEQLQTYSKIIDIPFAVCYSSAKLENLITEKFADRDLVLIDTPGSSWQDRSQLSRLTDYTERDFIDEVQLLLSLNTKSSDLRSIITKFSILNPDKILLTKLDETSTYGDIINIKESYDYPFSYLTFGQDVPDDIETASANVLFKYVFGDFYA
ncbi:flagellar biosynthesis protein FlhF [Halanaerobium salsuginis]|jgi:flagellar biosynthesis protein FlhF|uniref:Flagellar biosynthesis protein FlhF n=1 Tax=Halanaerobium salsuginis TaxID=29563 RepID=A0A1I4KJ83_9FIRM|nr:flagellar biosynthesis protein FlhF [Halanaerobium salsuginis]SFL78691.1 flagellar biosynthesis protein FlhF [Halanaerobium salsuginis]